MDMKITKVNIRRINNHPRIRASASVVLDDCIKICDILLMQAPNDAYYLSMPNRQLPNGTYKSVVYPTNNETRLILQDAIMRKYDGEDEDWQDDDAE